MLGECVSVNIDVEGAVAERYGKAAHGREEELCCPVEHDPAYLSAIPDEIKERDYGRGDPPTRGLEGDVVLDPGSGSECC